jgi:hypothetical protein
MHPAPRRASAGAHAFPLQAHALLLQVSDVFVVMELIAELVLPPLRHCRALHQQRVWRVTPVNERVPLMLMVATQEHGA